MRRFRVFFGLFTIFVIALAVQKARAQDDPNFEAGIKPYGTYHGGKIDTIDLSNGSLAVDIPLMSYPQRGGKLKLDFALHYENRGSYLDEFCYFPDSGEYCEYKGPGFLDHGFNIIQEHVPAGGYDGSCTHLYQGNTSQCNFSGAIKMSDGPVHAVVPISFANYQSTPITWVSSDGTDYSTSANLNIYGGYLGIITGPDGTRYTDGGLIPGPTRSTQDTYPPLEHIPYLPYAASLEDTNGNEITYSGTGWTDTVGRSIPDPVSASTSSCPQTPVAPTSAWTWALPGVNGGTYQILFCSITVAETIEQDDGLQDGGTTWVNYTDTQLQSVVLPDGTAWTFQYTSDGNGNLKQITFPTGGTLAYEWTSSPIIWATHDYINAIAVSTRTLNDGISSSETQYFYTCSSLCSTRLNDGAGNDSVHTFSGEGPGSGAYETEAKFYTGTAGSGTLLKTVDTAYTTIGTDAVGTGYPEAWQTFPSSVTTTWPNSQQSKVSYTYDAALAITNDYLVDFWGDGSTTYPDGQNITIGYGKELTKSEYDYGASSPTRTTTTSYLALSNSNYLNNNLLDLPSSVQVTDSGGTQRAYTTYAYDGLSLQSSGITTIGGVTVHDSNPPAGSYRGNLTSTSRWLNVTSGYVTDYKTFFDTGTVYDSVDANGSSATDSCHMTTYTYDSTGTFPTQIQHPPTGSCNVSHVENFTYDVTTGLMLTHSDQNNKTTYFETSVGGSPGYDVMWRLTNVIFPDGGVVTYCYMDTSNSSCSSPVPSFVFTDTISSTKTFLEVGKVDGVGRLIESQTKVPTSTCSGGYAYVDTSYDAVGRKGSVSNPYCTTSDPTYGVTTYTYDGLSRACVVQPPDGGTVTGSVCPTSNPPTNDVLTTYSGSCTTVTDQAKNDRTNCTDGLGRMTKVLENPSGLNYETDYTYDALDNLASVSQSSSRSRAFTFDSLSRLTQSVNPESGTINYTYDGNGNVLTKVAPQANQPGSSTTTTNYSYDALNRLTGRTYSNGDPSVSYAYDGVSPSGCTIPGSFSYGNYPKPHRTAMCDAAGNEAWSFDTMGRMLNDQRTTNSVTKTTAYTPNYDGSTASITYPGGSTIVYAPNVAAQPANAQDTTNSINYASGPTTCPNGQPTLTEGSLPGVCYMPQGSLASLKNGSSVVSTFYYNTRFQPCRISVKSSGTAPTTCTDSTNNGNVLDFQYSFDLSSMNSLCSTTFGTGTNNGDVAVITNNINSARSQNFCYDTLNRITKAQTTSTYSTSTANCWAERYSFDKWANLLSIAAPQSSETTAYNGCNQESGMSISATTSNQILGYCYDAAGNLLAQSAPPCNSPTYAYNGENQMTSTAGVTYVYDGDGKRVEKAYGGAVYKIYWYGMSGDALDESNGGGAVTDEYVFFGGKRIARRKVQ